LGNFEISLIKKTIWLIRDWDGFQKLCRTGLKMVRIADTPPVKKALCLICGGLLLANGNPAAAADAVSQQNDIPMMEKVVVSATKTEAKRKDIANSVILLDSEDIEESPAKSVGELLANEPGVDWRTRGNYGGATEEIHIRGMGAGGTQVLVNGVVINSPSLGSADVGPIPLNNIDHIEVIKGSGSVLYGSGAMGGTVNIITKKPRSDKFEGKAEAGYGTENTYRLSAENGMFVLGDIGYYLTANHTETDGFRDNSDLQHTDGSLNLIYDKGDVFELSLYGDAVHRKYGLPGVQPPPGTKDFFVNGVKFYNSESANLLDRGKDENYHTKIEGKSQVTDWLHLNAKADYSKLKNYFTGHFVGFGSKPLTANTIKGVEGNAVFSPFSRISLLAGSEYRDFTYENTQQSLDAVWMPIGEETTFTNRVFTHGLYAELTLQPIDQLRLIAGYRHERHSTFGDADVERYGLVFTPLENTVFKINHGKHFKAPTLNQLYYPDDGFAKGNTSLRPESGWHTDFTLEQSLFADKVFLSGSYFKWDIKDFIEFVEDPTQPTVVPGWNYWVPTNAFSYEASGWEMNAKLKPCTAIQLDLSLTLLDVTEERAPSVERQALYTPDKQFKGTLIYFTEFGFTGSATVRYVGSRPAFYESDNAQTAKETLDSYWTTDLQVAQEIAGHWRITLTGSNLFDKGYATYSSSFFNQTTFVTTRQPYPGAGRAGFLAVSYEF